MDLVAWDICQLWGDPVFTMHGQALCKWKFLHWVFGMFATSCYLCVFWSSHCGGAPGQHCGLSCQPHWWPCRALRYLCLCSTGFISFNKTTWKYSEYMPFFLPSSPLFLFYFLVFHFEIISNLTKLKKKLYIFFFLNHLRLSADEMPLYHYILQYVFFWNTF